LVRQKIELLESTDPEGPQKVYCAERKEFIIAFVSKALNPHNELKEKGIKRLMTNRKC
jgi:hypothetical protein